MQAAVDIRHTFSHCWLVVEVGQMANDNLRCLQVPPSPNYGECSAPSHSVAGSSLCSPTNTTRTHTINRDETHTTLAQLHSGHCRLMNSYKARITSGISDVCPECGVAPHSVEHLFNVKAIRHNSQCKTCGTTLLRSQTSSSSTWTTNNTIQYNADFYSALSRKRIGGAWRQCLDWLRGSVCRGKELRL